MARWTDGWAVEQTVRRIYGCTDRGTPSFLTKGLKWLKMYSYWFSLGQMNDGQMDSHPAVWPARQLDGWTDGRTDGQKE